MSTTIYGSPRSNVITPGPVRLSSVSKTLPSSINSNPSTSSSISPSRLSTNVIPISGPIRNTSSVTLVENGIPEEISNPEPSPYITPNINPTISGSPLSSFAGSARLTPLQNPTLNTPTLYSIVPTISPVEIGNVVQDSVVSSIDTNVNSNSDQSLNITPEFAVTTLVNLKEGKDDPNERIKKSFDNLYRKYDHLSHNNNVISITFSLRFGGSVPNINDTIRDIRSKSNLSTSITNTLIDIFRIRESLNGGNEISPSIPLLPFILLDRGDISPITSINGLTREDISNIIRYHAYSFIELLPMINDVNYGDISSLFDESITWYNKPFFDFLLSKEYTPKYYQVNKVLLQLRIASNTNKMILFKIMEEFILSIIRSGVTLDTDQLFIVASSSKDTLTKLAGRTSMMPGLHLILGAEETKEKNNCQNNSVDIVESLMRMAVVNGLKPVLLKRLGKEDIKKALRAINKKFGRNYDIDLTNLTQTHAFNTFARVLYEIIDNPNTAEVIFDIISSIINKS